MEQEQNTYTSQNSFGSLKLTVFWELMSDVVWRNSSPTNAFFLLILFSFNYSCKFSGNTSEIMTVPTWITSVCAILKWTDTFNNVDACKQKLKSATQSIWLIQPSWSLKLNRVNAALAIRVVSVMWSTHDMSQLLINYLKKKISL